MTGATFEAYREDHPDAAFTDWLGARSEPAWSAGASIAGEVRNRELPWSFVSK